jgi:hypothetical protein
MSLKVGFDFQDKLVREFTCTSSKWRWQLKLLLCFIDVVCVNAYVLWTLKYPNWRERKNHRRHLYLLSLGEIMVRPHIRKRTSSGNIDILRAMRARDVRCKQPASPTTVKKGGRRQCGRCSICPTAKDRKTEWKCCQCSEGVCKDQSIKTIQITCDSWKEQSYRGADKSLARPTSRCIFF